MFVISIVMLAIKVVGTFLRSIFRVLTLPFRLLRH